MEINTHKSINRITGKEKKNAQTPDLSKALSLIVFTLIVFPLSPLYAEDNHQRN